LIASYVGTSPTQSTHLLPTTQIHQGSEPPRQTISLDQKNLFTITKSDGPSVDGMLSKTSFGCKGGQFLK
jgi:hypothetical protein